MARIRSVFTRRLTLVQLTWMAVLALVVAATAIDGPAAVVGATVAVLLLLAVAGQSVLPRLHSLTESASGPPREEQRLRGAFRRQSAPDTPGRPRRPRAPGQVLAAA
ncbi:DUF6412 domain-containing protein [Rhodococcus sp. AG1013]|uniref:DUF6412 domain-containing protein n=1 Tax=unclassified Rhodococcus (in: high G+C Gram-positive bacteria) TaxID=192944 RepID=UPI000E0C4308|nr:DUF6412 domain-containing protein [Rhodococcus sp. AG1013]RDI18029.1 hypothetical protein DEU38_12166 [Rhodococcus sp. AG1013]